MNECEQCKNPMLKGIHTCGKNKSIRSQVLDEAIEEIGKIQRYLPLLLGDGGVGMIKDSVVVSPKRGEWASFEEVINILERMKK